MEFCTSPITINKPSDNLSNYDKKQSSIVKPMLQQFSLLFHQKYFLSFFFDGVLMVVGARTWYVYFRGNIVLYVSKSISIIYHEHMIEFFLLFGLEWIGFDVLKCIRCLYNAVDDFFQFFVIEFFCSVSNIECFFRLSFLFLFVVVASWSRQLIYRFLIF